MATTLSSHHTTPTHPHKVTTPFTITGVIPDHAQDLGVRKNIGELKDDEMAWSLYVQAITSVQQSQQSSIISFYQISGIHGVPYIEYDLSKPTDGGAGGSGGQGLSGGYCTHGSNLFPTWHRPYVALFEQILNQHAVEIAKGYKEDKDEWMKAAKGLRAPYWDWASEAIPPTEIYLSQTLNITTPTGPTTIDNPFLAYKFHPLTNDVQGAGYPFSKTVRYPTSGNANANSDPSQMVSALGQVANDLRDSTFETLSFVSDWSGFSNHFSSPLPTSNGASSVESIHDQVHVTVGGGSGHMSDPAVAAFDPIFWLHHCQVDRLVALWQTLHPQVYVTPDQSSGQTFGVPAGSPENETTNLYPFWKTLSPTKTYWNSDECRSTSALGYTYDDYVSGEDISSRVARLYGPQASQMIASTLLSTSKAPAPVKAASNAEDTNNSGHASSAPLTNILEAATSLLSLPSSSSKSNPKGHQADPPAQVPLGVPNTAVQYTRYFARIHVSQTALPRSFTVKIYLGAVDQASVVGGHSVFVNSQATSCDNCNTQAQHGNVSEGFVSLNTALNKRLGQGKSDDEIKAYLEKNVHWRVYYANNAEVQFSDPALSSLKVTICSSVVTYGGSASPNAPPATTTEPIEHQGLSRAIKVRHNAIGLAGA